jgi:Uma2 family endonuclease
MKPVVLPEIEYPESDGEPMGETQLHVAWTLRLLQILEHRHADQPVLVGANLIFYWVEGDPRKSVCPDVFVTLDCSPTPPRRTFRTWEEGRVPNCVIEVTSRRTRRRDMEEKPEVYAEMGIGEYFLYDPTADYLDPPLQGHRLRNGRYERIEPDDDGTLTCEELDVLLRLHDGELELLDRTTAEPLLTPTEAANAEVTRLRQRLADLGLDDSAE